MSTADDPFRLVSRSTTTGWLDWEHGELWLSSTGLLHRRRGWTETVASVGLVQDIRSRSGDVTIQQRFTSAAVKNVIEHRGLWIPADSIHTARLRAGIMTGRLNLGVGDGQSVKLLWARSPLTYESLREALSRWLHNQLRLD